MIRKNAYRPTLDFGDALHVIASYYDLYAKATEYVSPWISRTRGTNTPFNVEEFKSTLGGHRPSISPIVKGNFIRAIDSFVKKNKGLKNLITPNPSTHHSAQFPRGTFEISKVPPLMLNMNRNIRKSAKDVFAIHFYGMKEPFYIEDLSLPLDKVQFIILKPRMGKLGTASAINWEVQLFPTNLGFSLDHTDSNSNPRYAGVL